ncbi:restriction endonuclease subunit S [Pontibacter kalidii]|uniref:restriction endonuclease subunit S n=1 Tax=Pontibacter kalidii TaxID=2592049 RepID=UPI002254CB43|nr:restriction endonuclease subunit S [Pontibacter kalidii]
MEATAEITAAVKNVPALRFPEFEGEWVKKSIGSIAVKVGSGSTPLGGEKAYQDTGIPFIRSQNVNDDKLILGNVSFISEEINDKMKGSIVRANDMLLNITGGSIGRSCVVPDDFIVGNVNQHVCIIRLDKQNNPAFLQAHLSSYNGQKSLERSQVGSGREGLNFQSIRLIKFAFPTIAEQQKIASFLSAVNDKLQQLSKKKELLEKYKKGAMQQLFSRQIRFKDDNGHDFPEWEEKRLKDVAKRVTIKNKKDDINFVLTNSATQGIVSQQDYFDKDIANQENLEGYYVVDVDDFVYNPRISTAAPVGPIKRNKLAKGVMSPLYTVFRFEKQNLEFLEFFFETTVWHRYMKSVANYGARHDRMSITNDDLLGLPIPVPCQAEQQKITAFLSAIDNKLYYTKTQLEQAQQFKKGLLQQMFV